MMKTLVCKIVFLKVVLFPSPTKHFGYLVIVSCASVFTGLCFFVIFVWFALAVFFYNLNLTKLQEK